MKSAQHAAAICAAEKVAADISEKFSATQATLQKKEARKAELEALESPSRSQIDELLRIDRELPFLPPQLEKLTAELRSALKSLSDAIEAAWEMIEAEISGMEAVAKEEAAHAVLPWCDSLEQARNKAESFPLIARLNHKTRELRLRLDADDFDEVVPEVLKILERKPAKKTK